MKIHHLNCGTMCPMSSYFINGTGSVFSRGKLVCHCLLIESDEGLILVDTGIGHNEVLNPKENIDPGFLIFANPDLKPENTATQRLYNQDRLRKLVKEHNDEIEIFCAHDPYELNLSMNLKTS